MGTFDVTHGHAAAAGRQLLEALFPGRCLLCGRWLSRGDDLCAALCAPCRGTLAPIGAGRCAKCGTGLVSEIGICTRCRDAGFVFESNIAIFPYLREAKELIRKYKFEGRIRLAGFFADRAAEALPAEWETYPIVPVPPRPGRRIPDPVGRIAACLEKQRGKTVRRLLVRTGGLQQKSLDLPQRRENLRGVMRLALEKGSTQMPSRVILLDDIFTTGATIDACARVLRDAGCAGVYAITLAIEE